MAERYQTRRTKLARNPVLWVTAAAFGPYVIQNLGLRLEHIAIYGFGIWGLMSVLFAPRDKRNAGVNVAWVFGGCAAAAIAVTVLGPVRARDPLSIVADLDHYLRPVALSFGVAGWAIRQETQSIRTTLRHVCIMILVLLGANTLLSLAAGAIDVRAIVNPFRSGRTGDPLNAVESYLDFSGDGRITGIFAVPFDAGVAYSVGLFAWAYLAKVRSRPIPVSMYVALLSVVVGGFLSVSKAFLLGGIPVFVLYWLWGHQRFRMISARFALVAVIAVLGLNMALANWTGLEAMAARFNPVTTGSVSIIDFVTAGRFGTPESAVGGRVVDLWESGDLAFGVGLGTPIIIDNAYLWFLAQGGIAPLAAYMVLIAALAAFAWRSRRIAPDEARLLFIVMVYVAGAGMGAPVVSSVRASTLLWLTILLPLAAIARAQKAPRGERVAVEEPSAALKPAVSSR